MKIEILDQTLLPDGCSRFNIGVSDKERIYLGYILESFEGWCSYTTLHKSQPALQLDVVPDFADDFLQLFKFLKEWKIV